MRIAFLVPRATPDNSHGRYVIELAARLSSAHDVHVFTGARSPDVTPGPHWHRLPVPNRPTPVRLLALWTASLAVAARHRFDVTHTQGADAPTGTVVTASSCLAAVASAAGSAYAWRRRATAALATRLERHCLGRAGTRRVIVASRKVRTDIERHYHVDGAKMSIVPLGVDTKRFHPRQAARWRSAMRRQLDLASTDFVIVYVGGDYRLKGLLVLLRAMTALPPRVRLVALGVRPDPVLSAALAVDGLGRRVTLVPPTSTIERYYALGDGFALPSLYDTFSLATLEAMASGLPVIVSRDTGMAERLTDGTDALVLADPRDTADLAAKVGAIADDPTLRARLSRAARATAEGHSWEAVTRQTEEVYRQALG